MSNDIITVGPRKLEVQFRPVCNTYGVRCKAITQSTGIYSSEKEQYLVLSLDSIPDDINARELYIRQERSNALLYTDYFVIRIDDDAYRLGLIDQIINYCQAIEFLQKLYAEYHTPLPQIIGGDEIHGLKDYYLNKGNRLLRPEDRADYAEGLKKFFEQERSKSKYRKKWIDFSRSDKFDRHAGTFKMIGDFFKRKSQITTINVLQDSCDTLKSAIINEHEFEKFKKELQRLHPEVLYAVTDVEVQNEGFDVRHNKRKPVSKIQPGPYGKLVTYRAYCEEREKGFATEGFKAIEGLTPAYYESRTLTFKHIDESIIASVLNPIRFAYTKSDSLSTIAQSEQEKLPYEDIPLNDVMYFVASAKALGIPFHFDFDGKFGPAKLDRLRAVYRPRDKDQVEALLHRMANEKSQSSHICGQNYDAVSRSLDANIVAAERRLPFNSSHPVSRNEREVSGP